MWTWILGAYLGVLIALVGCAGYVTLFIAETDRAERALRTLKTATVAITGSTGAIALVVCLHETGLLCPQVRALSVRR
ncbi:hypothetical protein V5P93_003984 [Actinokineospora auranticolor]|uniref:Uncharacterized protein n=1 Tax=Actinokineospora auranticolor TaxID=155976 RepID=A0A2S6GB33_9PSEU|nr:hypothetical protein [Actinokineospora auranticolor]PPK60680.1 hypothetical protein CLV40_1497 [Actinokineospora auranticolor]